MRAWRRASHDVNCGAEMGCLIRQGDAYLELSGDGPTGPWRKYRCTTHADAACPKVMLEDTPIMKPPLGMSSAGQLAKSVRIGQKLLTFDVKAKAAKNDE